MNTFEDNNNQNNMEQNLPEGAGKVQEGFQAAHEREENAVGKAKESFQGGMRSAPVPVPTPPSSVTATETTAHELKSRLNWGEPGLTILDIRDPAAFDECHIMGALNIPASSLSDISDLGLEAKRDIYVYGESDAAAMSAVQGLQDMGFQKVSAISGGLQAWQDISGSLDGIGSNTDPSPGAYNVVARLQEFANERAREKSMK